MPDAVVVCDAIGRVALANREAQRLFIATSLRRRSVARRSRSFASARALPAPVARAVDRRDARATRVDLVALRPSGEEIHVECAARWCRAGLVSRCATRARARSRPRRESPARRPRGDPPRARRRRALARRLPVHREPRAAHAAHASALDVQGMHARCARAGTRSRPRSSSRASTRWRARSRASSGWSTACSTSRASRASASRSIPRTSISARRCARSCVATPTSSRARAARRSCGSTRTPSAVGIVPPRADLSNLLVNAIKFGPGRPVEVRVERGANAAAYARISVSDKGIGIQREDQLRIFERFGRAVPSRHYGGFGLGLWTVRQLVDAMGASSSSRARSERARRSSWSCRPARRRRRARSRRSGLVRDAHASGTCGRHGSAASNHRVEPTAGDGHRLGRWWSRHQAERRRPRDRAQGAARAVRREVDRLARRARRRGRVAPHRSRGAPRGPPRRARAPVARGGAALLRELLERDPLAALPLSPRAQPRRHARLGRVRAVNAHFTDVIAREYQPGDLVWVHDYQLMLVPAAPSPAHPRRAHRLLPPHPVPFAGGVPHAAAARGDPARAARRDLVGFHAFSYVGHFARSLLRVLGLEASVDSVHYEDREVRLGVFPMGIDVPEFRRLAATRRRARRGRVDARRRAGATRAPRDRSARLHEGDSAAAPRLRAHARARRRACAAR